MSNPLIKTGHASFHITGDAARRNSLFTVTPGIPALDALQSVSDLLSTIAEPIHAAAMGEQALEHNPAWLVNHTLASARAVIDSLIEALEYPADTTAKE